jgi:HD-like signal output (HDOD) protein
VLAERLRIEDPQKAYTASLLHDIGKIVFYLAVPDYGEMLKETKAPGISSPSNASVLVSTIRRRATS